MLTSSDASCRTAQTQPTGVHVQLPHGTVDTLSLTDLFKQLEKLAVMEVDEDMKQMVVPKVEILPLYGQSGGQEGGAQQKLIPKTFVRCEELSCQFSMELEDQVSAISGLENHKFMAHKRQKQNHQQELCGTKGGRSGAPRKNQYPIRRHWGLED